MEKLSERQRSEVKTYLWSPFRFLDQILKAIFECLGLFHRDSSTTTKTTSSSVTLNQPKCEKEEEDEDEDDVIMEEEEVVVTSRGFTNGVVVSSSRGIKIKAKKREKERHSSGVPGKHN